MRPQTPYETSTLLLGGGLNIVDAPDLLQEGEARELNNFGFAGQGRITPRKAATAIATIPGEIVGIAMFPHGSYSHTATAIQRFAGVAYLTWFEGRVDLYLGDGSGQNVERMGMLAGWSPVNSKPRLSLATINRKLFVADEAKVHGLTVFDPFHPLATTDNQTKFYQPSFVFDPTYAAQKMMPRALVEYNNFLIAAGYGTNGEPSRPEMVRFSYLGLMDDAEGAGDAGYVAIPGSPTQREFHENLNVFDIEDYFMVGERGTPVVAMAPALGRLVIGTPYNAWVLFGYDRDSFQLELLDNTRGCTGTNAMVSAHGMVYWWSPVGPVRWNGSGVEDLATKIRDEVDSLDGEKVVAMHDRAQKEVRFYQGRRGFSYNYEKGDWARVTLPTGFDVWCAGAVSPYTSTNTGAAAPRSGPGGKTDGDTGAIGAPTGLRHDGVTNNEAVSVWKNGDATPEVKTLLWRKRSTETSYRTQPTAYLDSGVNRFNHTGLEPGIIYDVQVCHEKNGKRTTMATASFTTLGVEVVRPPQSFQVLDDPVLKEGIWYASALLRWEVSVPGAQTQIWRRIGTKPVPPNDVNTAYYEFLTMTEAGEASYRDLQTQGNGAISNGGDVTYLINHFSGQGKLSNPAPAVQVTLSAFRVDEPSPPTGGGGEDDDWGKDGRFARIVANKI